MNNKKTAVVIGGGIVGIATSRVLQKNGWEVIVAERHKYIGSETSSRNSGVIHSGIYYPTNSLKSFHCVRGRNMLYEYLSERSSIIYKKCGKLIVACDENELNDLERIKHQAESNHVNDLKILNRNDVINIEPECDVKGALLCPSTGMVDVHTLLESLSADADSSGVMIALNCDIQSIKKSNSNNTKYIINAGNMGSLECDAIINSGGLSASFIAQSIQDYPTFLWRRTYYAKGTYFRINRTPFHRLVYPIPERTGAGLGIHSTPVLNEEAVRFGPDVEWLSDTNYSHGSNAIQEKNKQNKDEEELKWYHNTPPLDIAYNVDVSRAVSFYNSIRRYFPGLQDGELQPDYCGIRPKLCAPGQPSADFVIETSSQHGMHGLVNLYGIESPGVTSSLSIAKSVAEHIIHEFD